jgi:hypothetical protein
MSPESLERVGCFGLGLMAVGFTLVAIGLGLATAAATDASDPGLLVIGISLVGIALFITGAAIEIRDWFRLRAGR